METILESFANCLSFENGIDIEQAQSLTRWLESEGALDYDVLRQTYAEPRPNIHLVAANA